VETHANFVAHLFLSGLILLSNNNYIMLIGILDVGWGTDTNSVLNCVTKMLLVTGY
jgi:hypothetical protein